MKVSKKIICIIVAAIFMISSASFSMAQLQTIVAQDQAGNYEYDLQDLNDSYAEFQLDNNSNDAKLYKDFMNRTSKAFYDDVRHDYVSVADINSKYGDAQLAGESFDARHYAETNAALADDSITANLKTVAIVNGQVVISPKNTTELTVVDVDVDAGGEQIFVTFSNGDDVTYDLDSPLAEGDNTVTFDYLGQHFSRTITYHAPVVAPAVESIQLVNYREMKVTFNTVVDEASAEDPANYYFAIVEGNGAQGYGADNTLKEALSFAEINDEVSGVVLSADSSSGKTIVTINFPEDARFTYRLDTNKHLDDERVIKIEKANGEWVALDEGETVDIAVRNVTLNGEFRINTYVQNIKIEDLVHPNLLPNATKLMTDNHGEINPVVAPLNQVIDIDNSTYVEEPDATLTINKIDDCRTSETATLSLDFDEPVFDGHLNAWSELENPEILSNVQIFINDTKVAETCDHYSFDQMVKFYMEDEDSYADSCKLDLNLYRAVAKYIWKTSGDRRNFWNAGKTYNVKIKGVTDIAGNIQIPSTINFNIRLVEPPTRDTTITYYPPQVKKVVQVADNVLRVYFDQAVTDFTFVIEAADGDSGNITKCIHDPLMVKVDDDLWYYDVYVPASDADFTNWPEKILSYRNQAFVNTKVTIKEILNTTIPEVASQVGASKEFPKTLVKDIMAPVGDHAFIKDGDIKLDYYDDLTKDAVIRVALKDLTPFEENANPNEVYAAKYLFGHDEFTDVVDLAHGDYLPVTISYTDARGTHSQVVSNQPNLAHNPGIPGAITYDEATDSLVIDLNLGDAGSFLNLLNDDGKLIEGATYTVSIPKGYFSDEKRLDAYLGDYNSAAPSKLYVDDGRGIWCRTLGFASEPISLTFTVPVKEIVDEDEFQGVPQTTKELIKWDEVQKAIIVEFTGEIDLNTLENSNNYLLDGTALPAGTQITYQDDTNGTLNDLSDDHQYAIIKLPADTVAVDGFVDFEVRNVANPEGGKMTPVTTKIELADNTRPTLMSAVVSGSNEIILTFSEPLEYKAGENAGTASKNFVVTINGSPSDVANAAINLVNDVTKVTLTVNGTVFSSGDVVKVIVKADVNGAINIEDRSKNQNPIRIGEYNVQNNTL